MRFRARSKFKEARGNGAWMDEAGRRGRETMSTLRTGCVADPPRVFQTRTHLHRKRRSSHEFFIRSLSFPLLPSTAPPHPSPPLPSLPTQRSTLAASFNNCPMALNIRAAKLSILSSSSCMYDYLYWSRIILWKTWSIRRIGNRVYLINERVKNKRYPTEYLKCWLIYPTEATSLMRKLKHCYDRSAKIKYFFARRAR